VKPESLDYASAQPPRPRPRPTTDPITAIIGILFYGPIALILLVAGSVGLVQGLVHGLKISDLEIAPVAFYTSVLCFSGLRVYQAVIALRDRRR
jgi:hypothetical protein